MRVPAVVEEYASTGNSVFGPMVDGTFVVGFWTEDVFTMGVVVKGPGWDMGELKMSSVVHNGFTPGPLTCRNLWHS